MPQTSCRCRVNDLAGVVRVFDCLFEFHQRSMSFPGTGFTRALYRPWRDSLGALVTMKDGLSLFSLNNEKYICLLHFLVHKRVYLVTIGGGDDPDGPVALFSQ